MYEFIKNQFEPLKGVELTIEEFNQVTLIIIIRVVNKYDLSTESKQIGDFHIIRNRLELKNFFEEIDIDFISDLDENDRTILFDVFNFAPTDYKFTTYLEYLGDGIIKLKKFGVES